MPRSTQKLGIEFSTQGSKQIDSVSRSLQLALQSGGGGEFARELPAHTTYLRTKLNVDHQNLDLTSFLTLRLPRALSLQHGAR